MFPTAGVQESKCLMQAGPRLVHHDCTALHHRLKCVSLTAYRLTTFYLTKRLLFWYTFECSKVRPDGCRGFFFLWGAVYPEPRRAALFTPSALCEGPPLCLSSAGACHALRLRSLRVAHFVAPASCRHFSFLRELYALLSVVGACPDPVGVLSPCLFFCC